MTSKRRNLACNDLEIDSPDVISGRYDDNDDDRPYRTNIRPRGGPVDERMDSGFKSMANQTDSMETLDSSMSHLSLDAVNTQLTSLTTTTTSARMPNFTTPLLVPAGHSNGQDECYDSMGETTAAARANEDVSVSESTPFVSVKDDKLSKIIRKCVLTLRRDPNILVNNLSRQDSERNSVLHWTIALGWVRDSQTIIKCMPELSLLERRNDLRQTPLILALLTRQSVVVEALVQAGVDLTLLDRHGDSCFHIAAKTGDLDSLFILGKRMTSQLRKLLNQQNASGLAPVHIAVQEGHIHIFEHLKRLGADVNRRDGKAGYTPLHHAIRTYRETNMNMIVYLVQQAKVDLSAADYSRRTPIMTAEGYRCPDLVAYLRRKGTKEDRDWLNCPPFSDDSDSGDECSDEESESDGVGR